MLGRDCHPDSPSRGTCWRLGPPNPAQQGQGLRVPGGVAGGALAALRPLLRGSLGLLAEAALVMMSF